MTEEAKPDQLEIVTESGETLPLERIVIGHVGVDSARLVIADPTYLGGHQDQELFSRIDVLVDEHLADIQVWSDTPESERGPVPELSHAVLYLKGHEGAAVVFQSGIGDGYYPVTATYADLPGWGRRIVKVEIDLLDNPMLTKQEGEETEAGDGGE